MSNIEGRKKEILEAIIKEHIVNASPVGSRTIARRSGMEISPATIRNEMSDLEEMGYLKQPHTSAGRVPSDKGYRFYVDNLMKTDRLSRDEELFIRRGLEKKKQNIEVIIEETSKLLSFITDYTSLVLQPRINKTCLEKIEMVKVNSRHILLVIITDTGFIENQVIKVDEELSRDELDRIYRLLNTRLHGLPLEDIDSDLLNDIEDELLNRNEIINQIVNIINGNVKFSGSENIRLVGTPNMLEQPEFKDVEKVKKLLYILEEEWVFKKIFQKSFDSTGVVISIGEENEYKEIQECSLIMAQYKMGRLGVGSIGVLGPTRMKYARAISAVDFISSCLSELLTQLKDYEVD